MKILIDIPKDLYDKICLSVECGMGGFAFQYIAYGQIVEDEAEEKIKNARIVDITETTFADKIPKWQIPLIIMFAKMRAKKEISLQRHKN